VSSLWCTQTKIQKNSERFLLGEGGSKKELVLRKSSREKENKIYIKRKSSKPQDSTTNEGALTKKGKKKKRIVYRNCS
jgi:hypothetical protein